MSEMNKTAHSAGERENTITALYETAFPMVAKFVSKRGGSLEQAKDVFHDALIIWYEKGDGLSSSFAISNKAYIFGIAKHLWYKKFSEGEAFLCLHAKVDMELETDEKFSSVKLLALLESTGRKCLEMLKSFYYDKLSMDQLASGFGFSSVRSATVQKYKCLEKVRETVKEKSLQYEDFLE
jgi:DNA-directed RNA polymerase specialized sigma24 family protein